MPKPIQQRIDIAGAKRCVATRRDSLLDGFGGGLLGGGLEDEYTVVFKTSSGKIPYEINESLLARDYVLLNPVFFSASNTSNALGIS